MDQLAIVLREFGGVARIYYRGSCQLGPGHSIFLPMLNIQAPTPGAKGLRAIQQMFRGNRDVSVVERMPRIITIVVGSGWDPFLDTKISQLTFKPLAQYNAGDAILTIEENTDVLDAMSRKGVELQPLPILWALVEPDPTLRHLPSTLTQLTLDQALDAVARTFGAIVLYGSCSEPPRFQIRGYSIYGSAEDVPPPGRP